MADLEKLERLKRSVPEWNKWREDEVLVEIDLTDADLSQATLYGANLKGVNLKGATLVGAQLGGANLTAANLNKANLRWATAGEAYFNDADLSEADLSNSNLRYSQFINVKFNRANLCSADAQVCHFSRSDFLQADLKGAILSHSDFHSADLSGADFTGATLLKCRFTTLPNERETNLAGTLLEGVDLTEADFMSANLRELNLSKANLTGANLSWADLRDADLREANLTDANLRLANLCAAKLNSAKLINADLMQTDLSDADLTGADLGHANLVKAIVTNAIVNKSNVYGVSVWDLQGEFKEQKEIIITPEGTSPITVDNIKVAQFMYLILNNKEIRDVLNTLTSKSVLILGRFSLPERKAILDALRNKLREYDLLPIVFDFERPTDKDFTETIKTLAGMCYFVIADVTNPKSSPLELQATVPDYQIPFVPIIQEDERPFAMMQNLQTKYKWVLETISYRDGDQLIRILKKGIIDRAMQKHDEMRLIKAEQPTVISASQFEE